MTGTRRRSGRPVVAPAPRRRRPDRRYETVDVLAAFGCTFPAWFADALCREHPDIVFVTNLPKMRSKAIQVCGRCAVREECLDYAMADPNLVGVWGGTTEAARLVMRRARRKADADSGRSSS